MFWYRAEDLTSPNRFVVVLHLYEGLHREEASSSSLGLETGVSATSVHVLATQSQRMSMTIRLEQNGT